MDISNIMTYDIVVILEGYTTTFLYIDGELIESDDNDYNLQDLLKIFKEYKLNFSDSEYIFLFDDHCTIQRSVDEELFPQTIDELLRLYENKGITHIHNDTIL